MFAPGERVGFFIEPARARAQGETIDVWAGKSEALNPDKFEGFGAGTFTTLDAFNPEVRQADRAHARHAAMMWMPAIPGFANGQPFLVVGFEDATRSAGHEGDFSDVVFAVIPGKPGALSATRVHSAALGDVDGDGVDSVFDAYPYDAERAFLTHMPASGCVTIALEDGYPDIGDLDYNDVVVRGSWTLVSDAHGRVKDLLASLHLLECDPRRQYRVGLRLPPLPAHVQGNVWTERFWGRPEQHALAVRTIEEARTMFDGCLPAPFPATRSAGNSPAAARVQVSFDQAIDAHWLVAMPLEPYFVIQRGDQQFSVHLPGARGLPRRVGELAIEQGPESYLSRGGYPFLLVVPKAWQAPPQGVPVGQLYPGFRTWVGSRGALACDWYETSRRTDTAPAIELDPSERVWSLRLEDL
jgi:LruC domain-containing protein